MAQLTPRDDIKKMVSEILKRVDQLLKAGSLDEAAALIAKARETDPKNVYVSAYEERLAVLKEERSVREEAEAKRRAEEEKKRAEEEARRKAEEAKRRAEEEARKKAEEERKRKEEEEKKKREEAGQKAGTQAVPDIPREVLEEAKRSILEGRKKKEMPAEVWSTASSAYEEGLEIYRRVLTEAWEDGATTKEENEQLTALRGSLRVRQEDHDRLEREAKIAAYTKAFRLAWSSGAISPASATALADLRKKFNITLEEHEAIEAQLLWELRPSSQKVRIVVIDDDEKLLKVISDSLQEAGFQTLPFTTTDEAFKALKDTTPDMIISDINLETSTMGGFSFYEKVREIDRLQDIPFIFLSGLTDEVLIRTGKELGVDDYITKPFSHDTLIATIRGKLKRYRQLKNGKWKRENLKGKI